MYASHSSTATRHLFYYTPPATSEIYTLSLHDALPICSKVLRRHARTRGTRAAGDASRPRRYLVFGTSRPRSSLGGPRSDRKSTRLNSSHRCISYAVFCLKKKKHSTTSSEHF